MDERSSLEIKERYFKINVEEEEMLSPMKAIRAKCLECCAGQPKEVRACECDNCALHPFRLGKNPNRQGIGNLKGSYLQKFKTQKPIL